MHHGGKRHLGIVGQHRLQSGGAVRGQVLDQLGREARGGVVGIAVRRLRFLLLGRSAILGPHEAIDDVEFALMVDGDDYAADRPVVGGKSQFSFELRELGA